MSISQLQVQEYMGLFTGSKHNYGEFLPSGEKKKGKQQGAYRMVTNKLITVEQYKDHLNGKVGLGIIPIDEHNRCKFSTIDVDIYDSDLMMYISALERGGFPLVPFKSKSGGLHIYMFFKEPENVAPVLDLMRKFCSVLSIDLLVKRKKRSSVEIFPKQTKLMDDAVGSYINLPYFNSTDTQQYVIRKGNPLNLNDALVYIKDRLVTLGEAKEFYNGLAFSDAPPCLQKVYVLNPTDANSGRNNYLFSFGVYLKKKDETYFEQNLHSINDDMLDPLDSTEVDKTILSSLRKRDYVYKCKEAPCIDFCNKKECRQREYGIGKNDGYFSSVECGQLCQYKTSQPYYEWDVRLQGQETFKKLRFRSEDEIIKQDAFLRLCMRELYELPSKLKQMEWFNKVNQALKEIKIVDVNQEDDMSPITVLKNMVADFLTGQALAETKNQILSKRVYFDKTIQAYLFRVKDLSDFLFRKNQFRYFGPQDIHGILREWKCDSMTIRTESKKQVRVRVFPKSQLESYLEEDSSELDFSKYNDEQF